MTSTDVNEMIVFRRRKLRLVKSSGTGMKVLGRAAWTSIVILVSSSSLMAAFGWETYGNARFKYWIDIPPGFSSIVETENGDGGISSSPDGGAKLSVWGGYLTNGNFAAEVLWHADQDRSDGWNLSYRKQRTSWAVWSGAKGDRIFYERAITVCDGAVAYFRFEYDNKQAKAFNPIISKLAKSLRSGSC